MLLPPCILFFGIKGHSHQFCKVEDWKTHVLPHLEVSLTESAGSDNTLRPCLLCHGDNLSHHLLNHIPIGQRQVCTTTVNLIGPLHRLCTDGFHDPIHILRVLGIIQPGHLGMPHQRTSIVAGRLQSR